MWQWEGDRVGEWHPYSIEVASLLEKGHRCHASTVDLNRHPFCLPYVVHLSSMVQIRTTTNYKRRVRRLAIPQPYMPALSNFSHASSSPFPTPVFQPSNATANGLSGSSFGVFQVPGTPSINPGSAVLPLQFLNSLSLGFGASSASSSVTGAGPLWSGNGINGRFTAGSIANASLSGNSGIVNVQKPLFTIGSSTPLDSTPKKKRALVHNLTSGSR